MGLIIRVIKYLIVILSIFTLISFIYETVINKKSEDNHFTDAPKEKQDLITKPTTVFEETLISKKSEGSNYVDVTEQEQELLVVLAPILEPAAKQVTKKVGIESSEKNDLMIRKSDMEHP